MDELMDKLMDEVGVKVGTGIAAGVDVFRLQTIRIGMMLLALAGMGQLRAAVIYKACARCNMVMAETVYILTDKVTGEKLEACENCAKLPRDCFLCGLPVPRDYTELPDGRFLCARDARNAVLDDDEAGKVCAEVRDGLDRLFSRFMSFPQKRLETAITDRVNLQVLFKTPGNDSECPNVLGYLQTQTNRGHATHKISVLSGLPRGELRSVCAHEISHVWIYENVPESRQPALGRDAQEAFCELVAYLYLDSLQDAEQMNQIRRNHYTRGQLELFIAAEQRYGLNEVIDWMKYGVDSVLHREDLNRMRTLERPGVRVAGTNQQWWTYGARVQPVPGDLVLKGISWVQNRPLALINDRTLGIGEEARVPVGSTNMLIRCLAISQNSARVRVLSSGEERSLSLPNR